MPSAISSTGWTSTKGAKPVDLRSAQGRLFRGVQALARLLARMRGQRGAGSSSSPDRRIWFVLDELADLPRVENLARLLPEGRKFGAAVVLTFQALGQMRHRYGRDIAEAMLACCNTKLFLQIVDRETRQWASETIGECEVEMRSVTDSFDGPKSAPDLAWHHAAGPRSRDRKRYAPRAASGLFCNCPMPCRSRRIRLTARSYRRGAAVPRQPASFPAMSAGRCGASCRAKGAEAEATIKADGPV